MGNGANHKQASPSNRLTDSFCRNFLWPHEFFSLEFNTKVANSKYPQLSLPRAPWPEEGQPLNSPDFSNSWIQPLHGFCAFEYFLPSVILPDGCIPQDPMQTALSVALALVSSRLISADTVHCTHHHYWWQDCMDPSIPDLQLLPCLADLSTVPPKSLSLSFCSTFQCSVQTVLNKCPLNKFKLITIGSFWEL